MPSPSADDAQTKASVDSKFQKVVEGIQKAGRNRYAGWMAEEQTKWDIPEENRPNDLFDIEGLHSPAFDRDELNAKYKECIQDPAAAGTMADVVAIKKQIEYLAQEERAFRFRHASLGRCLAFAAGRDFAAGNSNVQPAILREIESLIKAGGAS